MEDEMEQRHGHNDSSSSGADDEMRREQQLGQEDEDDEEGRGRDSAQASQVSVLKSRSRDSSPGHTALSTLQQMSQQSDRVLMGPAPDDLPRLSSQPDLSEVQEAEMTREMTPAFSSPALPPSAQRARHSLPAFEHAQPGSHQQHHHHHAPHRYSQQQQALQSQQQQPQVLQSQQQGVRGDTLMTLEAMAHTLSGPHDYASPWSVRSRTASKSKSTHSRRRLRSRSCVDHNAEPVEDKHRNRITYVESLPFPQDTRSSEQTNIVTLMVIAMKKKVMATPMQTILTKLAQFKEFKVLVLAEELFQEDITAWPKCDCLIAFYSTGYNLRKVEQYVALRKPFLLNDLAMQHRLLDRRQVYKILEENNIPVPPYVVLDRTDGQQPELIEREDAIVVNGQTITKPFVMKPIDAEDHNIYVYFSQHDGGGAQHLFRKRKDRASEFIADKCDIPKEGSYIFEKFLTTGGTDIKVYTVGPNYAHAEGRKAPVVDGKVLRDNRGKELRCPILLNAFEKEIAKKVVQAFKQNVCGFDLLRTQEHKSYVCDVNGWSFVKRSPHYFDDCARILRLMVLQACAPRLLADELPIERPIATPRRLGRHRRQMSQNVELRCVIGLIRHADRTPKEKLKLKVDMPEFLELYNRWAEDLSNPTEIKLKTRLQLEDALSCIQSVQANPSTNEELRQALGKIEQVLTRWPISGINRKLQLKPLVDGKTDRVKGLKLVMKWGGELTPSGLHQAQRAGTDFRELMYPKTTEMNGLLRLHSTYRHDLKLYSSDEGRVQMTAAAFAKGLLQLDGEITPILVSLVRKDRAVNMLLDETKGAREDMDRVKQTISHLLLQCEDWDSAKRQLVPDLILSQSVDTRLQRLSSGREAMLTLYEQLTAMVEALDEKIKREPSISVYRDEPVTLLQRRWHKLQEEFYDAKHDTFVVSKIPDIYDSAKYMALHNPHLDLQQLRTVLELSKSLADIVVPQEYGITRDDKINIGKNISGQLIRKLVHDLKVAAGKETTHRVFQHEVSHRLDSRRESFIHVRTPDRNVRTRLYFTSESHIHSLLNVIRCGDYGLFGHRWVQERQRRHRDTPSRNSLQHKRAKPSRSPFPPQGNETAEKDPVLTQDDEEASTADRQQQQQQQQRRRRQEEVTMRDEDDAGAVRAEGDYPDDQMEDEEEEREQMDTPTPTECDFDDSDDSDHEDCFDSEGHWVAKPPVPGFTTMPTPPGHSCGYPTWCSGMRYLSESSELNYLSQVVCRLFERPDVPESDPNRFFVEFLVTNGTPVAQLPPHPARRASTGSRDFETDERPPTSPYVVLHPGLPLQCVEAFFRQFYPTDDDPPPPQKAAASGQ